MRSWVKVECARPRLREMHTRVLNLYKAALVKLHNPGGNDDSKDPQFLNLEQTTRGDIDMEDLITRLLPTAPVDEGVVRNAAPRRQHGILVLQQHVARKVLIFLNNVARQTGPLLEKIDETASICSLGLTIGHPRKSTIVARKVRPANSSLP